MRKPSVVCLLFFLLTFFSPFIFVLWIKNQANNLGASGVPSSHLSRSSGIADAHYHIQLCMESAFSYSTISQLFGFFSKNFIWKLILLGETSFGKGYHL